ncbi:MAG: hypothetical protein RLZZ546_101, partial [Bacteroidota bacterium]
MIKHFLTLVISILYLSNLVGQNEFHIDSINYLISDKLETEIKSIQKKGINVEFNISSERDFATIKFVKPFQTKLLFNNQPLKFLKFDEFKKIDTTNNFYIEKPIKIENSFDSNKVIYTLHPFSSNHLYEILFTFNSSIKTTPCVF